MKTFLLPPLSLSLFSFFFLSLFSGTLLGRGAQAPQAPPPLGAPLTVVEYL